MKPVTTLEELDALDSDLMVRGYQLGFKVVPAGSACVKREAVEFLRQIAANVLSNEDSAWQALGDE